MNNDLPAELHTEIIKYLNDIDIFSLSTTSTVWRTLITLKPIISLKRISSAMLSHIHDLLPISILFNLSFKTGNLDILKYAMKNNDNKWSEYADYDIRFAAQHNHLHVLKWAYRHGCGWSKLCCSSAAKNNHLSVLQWLRKKGCEWTNQTCKLAAKHNHLNILQWAYLNGCPMKSDISKDAAMAGNLEILQWLRSVNQKFDVTTCAYAALGGHLDVLKWLHNQNCEWNSDVCDNAARTIIWRCYNGLDRKVVIGVRKLVPWLRIIIILI